MGNKSSNDKKGALNCYNAVHKEKILNGYLRQLQTQPINTQIPSKILETCGLYCFFLDEFIDLKSSSSQKQIKQHKILYKFSKKTSIIGADNTIIDSRCKSKQYIIGSRVIPSLSGIHFWKLALNANNPKCKVSVRLMYDRNDKHLHMISDSFFMTQLPNINDDPLFIEMYFNSSGYTLIYSVNNIRRSPIKFKHILNSNYRMIIEMIGINKQSIITVQLISYQSSELCLRIINNKHNKYNKNELAKAYINYSELSYNIQTKLIYTKYALDLYPQHDTWNSLYIDLLMKMEKYNQAYNYVKQIGKGQLGIANLASYYEDKQHFKIASELYDFLDDYTMNEGCSSLIVGVCKQKNGEYKNALKLFYKQMDINNNDLNGFDIYKAVCKIHIAVVHYELNDFMFCLKILMRLDNKDEYNYNYFTSELSNDNDKKINFCSFLNNAIKFNGKEFEINQENYNRKMQMIINAMCEVV